MSAYSYTCRRNTPAIIGKLSELWYYLTCLFVFSTLTIKFSLCLVYCCFALIDINILVLDLWNVRSALISLLCLTSKIRRINRLRTQGNYTRLLADTAYWIRKKIDNWHGFMRRSGLGNNGQTLMGMRVWHQLQNYVKVWSSYQKHSFTSYRCISSLYMRALVNTTTTTFMRINKNLN